MDNNEAVSVVFAGVGGQGILLASAVTAQAAMNAGFQVKMNEVHGMAQRGGSVIAQIRYGKDVHSPLVEVGKAKVLGALERIEAIRYAHYLAEGGLAVVSDQAIVPVTVSMGSAAYPGNAEQKVKSLFKNLVYLNAVDRAVELGNAKAANVVLLGAISTGLDLPEQAWKDAIASTVKKQFVDLNLKAFDIGRETVK